MSHDPLVLKAPSVSMPPGWPIINDGLYMHYIGPVLLTFFDNAMSDEAYEQFLVALEQIIVTREVDKPTVTFFHVIDTGSNSGVQAARQKKSSAMLKRHREKLRRDTAGYVMCTQSAFMRAALRAIFALAPPPYPYTVVKNPQEGFHFLARLKPGVDPAFYMSLHDQLYAAHLAPRLRARSG